MRAVEEKNSFDSVRTLIRTGAAKQIFFMISIAVSIALGITLYMSIREPVYQALDYQLTDKNTPTIVDILEKSKINYKINEQDGLVMVPSSDYEMAKLKLSAAGVAKDDSYSYSFMNDQTGFNNSQFIENARYIKALESDLAKTISGIEGISGARVHIAMPRNNLFADENNKPTASVFINIAAGFANNKEKIRSIIQVVADSVPGLDPKDVSITDQYGHFLSDGMDPGSVFSAAQLTYQNNVQSYYENRIESMIVPLLGENKVIVRVNADIDFTQQENAQEVYDPAKSAVLSEQEDNVQNSAGSGASGPPGSLSNSAPGGANAQQAQQGGQAKSASGGESHTQSTKNYDVSKSVTYKKNNESKIKSLSVAVVIDNESVYDPKTKQFKSVPVSQEKINKITDLVKTVIGYDAARGDKVTVINSVYNQIKEEIPAIKTHVWDYPWFWDVIKKIIGILFGFGFLFLLYKKIISNSGQSYEKSYFVAEEDNIDTDSINRLHNVKNDGMKQLKELAVNDPDKIATIIKNWIRK